MKRYDGRTKPIPKPRPAKKKGVSVASIQDHNLIGQYKGGYYWVLVVDCQKEMFNFPIKGEAAQPEDSTSISSSSRTLGVHVPCQVFTQLPFFLQFGWQSYPSH